MISKLRFSLVAVIMLVLLGFGFQNQAQAQVGTDGLFCPAVPDTTGWLEVNVEAAPALPFPDFSGALIGTVDSLIGGPLHGGMDWQHVDFTSFFSPTPTNETGSQIVSWWTQKDGRNTYLQVTNAINETGTWVHVHIFDENCVEIRNFCDFYTEFDTHVYNFGDIISNIGVDEADANLQGKEGFVTVTAVDNCPTPGQAQEHDYLAGNTFIKSVAESDYMYGFATYHREGVCFDITTSTTVNLVQNGSFQNGPNFGPWSLGQGNSSGISEANISVGTVPIPAASGPDADNPNSNLFMGFAVSSSDLGATSPPYQGGPFSELARPRLVQSAQGPFETNVTVVTSNIFTTDESKTLTYDISFLRSENAACDNYAMVCVIDDTTGVAEFEACQCYIHNEFATSATSPPSNSVGCVNLGDDDQQYNVSGGGGNFTFGGTPGEQGRSAFVTNESLSINGAGTYAVQFITGQTSTTCADNSTLNNNNGAFVDNFTVLDTVIETLECDGILDGSENAFLDIIVPNVFAGQFDAQTGTAGADAVHINFYDEYLPSYTPQAAFINAVVGIWNDVEKFTSCGELPVCFARLGIDEALILSDNFVGPPTTAPPTTAPTLGPTTAPPTTTPNRGGGSGSCAIAGNPVQLGTAFANVLIPLVPVAFVFGIRAMRRRKK